MLSTVKFTVVALGLVAAAMWFEWDDAFHAFAGVAFLVCLAGLAAARRRRRGHGDEPEFEGEFETDQVEADSLPRTVLLGCGAAILMVALLLPYFWCLEQTPFYVGFLDRDRTELETKCATLEAAGAFLDVARTIEHRLRGESSNEWRRALQARHYRNLLCHVRGLASPGDRVRASAGAEQLAADYGIEGSESRALKAQAETEITHLRQAAEAKRGFVALLDMLLAKGRWTALADVIETKIQTVEKADWPCDLERWLYDSLLAWGDQELDQDRKLEIFERATEVAARFEFDGSAARRATAVALEERSRRMDSAEQRMRFVARVDDLEAQCRWADLVSVLRFAMTEGPKSEWPVALDQRILDALLAWGGELGDLKARLAKFEEALVFAGEQGLDSRQAAQAVEAARDAVLDWKLSEEARLSPVLLPQGARAGIAEVDTDPFPPSIVVEVWISDREGEPIQDLKPKDFQVSVQDKPVAKLELGSFERGQSPMNVVLALDTSGSMKGEPIKYVQEGAVKFLNGIEGGTWSARVLSFSDRVHVATPWLTGGSLRGVKLGKLEAAGSTALYRAALRGVEELASKSGRKCLVLFTDGKDSVGGTADEVIARCRQAGVRVHVLGLSSSSLEGDTLKRIAARTGGRYLTARDASQLVEVFGQASLEVNRSYYRLIATPGFPIDPDSVAPRLDVTVGGGADPIRLSRALEVSCASRSPSGTQSVSSGTGRMAD